MRARVGAGAAGAMRDRGRTAGRARGSQMDQSPTTCQMVQARTELTQYSAARLAVLPCPVYRTGAARAKSFASGTPGPSRCATPGLRASSTSEGLTSGCRPRAVKATLSCPHRTALHCTAPPGWGQGDQSSRTVLAEKRGTPNPGAPSPGGAGGVRWRNPAPLQRLGGAFKGRSASPPQTPPLVTRARPPPFHASYWWIRPSVARAPPSGRGHAERPRALDSSRRPQTAAAAARRGHGAGPARARLNGRCPGPGGRGSQRGAGGGGAPPG